MAAKILSRGFPLGSARLTDAACALYYFGSTNPRRAGSIFPTVAIPEDACRLYRLDLFYLSDRRSPP